jgi:outer membrane receptor protein involved in Fe transport
MGRANRFGSEWIAMASFAVLLPSGAAAQARVGQPAPVDRPLVADGAVASPAGSDPHSPAEDIVVTARRRQGSAQKVPESILAFSGATLRQFAIQNVSDLNQIASGVTIQRSALTTPPVRKLTPRAHKLW